VSYPCPRCDLAFDYAPDMHTHRFNCRAIPAPKPKRKNPGAALEKLIRDSVDQFGDVLSIDQVSPRTVGRHGPGGTFSGQVVGKGLLDFVGDWAGRAVYFDTKSCDDTSFPLKYLEPHQVTRVERAHSRGAIGFFLVAFPKASTGPRYFVLPWPILAPYLADNARRKSIPFAAFLSCCPEIKKFGKGLDVLGAIQAAGDAA
jgi:hypothetical protein